MVGTRRPTLPAGFGEAHFTPNSRITDYPYSRKIRLQPLLELSRFHCHILQNLAQQAGAECFTRMHRHNRDPPVRVPQEVVTAPDAHYDKTHPAQHREHLAPA